MSDIKANKPSAKSKFRQGYYKLINAEKYVGDPAKIIYRSSWEHRFCRYCDLDERVVKWSSEPIGIKYISPLDNKEHTYYVDFYMRTKIGERISDILVEVKPSSSLVKPVLEGKKITTKKLQSYNHSLKTWLVNRSKFEAAKMYAEGRGYKFMIVTEQFLFNS